MTASRTNTGFGELATETTSVAGSPLHEVAYERDDLGRIVGKTEVVEGVATTYAYEYDLAGRLVWVERDGMEVESYAYDTNGNRLSYTGELGSAAGSYDAQDRLLTYGDATYAYNENGDLLAKTDSSGVTTYDYDVLGNLRSVVLPDGTAIEYVIDGQNRRVGKKVDSLLVQGLLYKDRLNPVAELGGSGTVVSRFVYGTKAHVPDYMVKGGVTYRFVTDQVGSVRLVVNAATGALAQRIDYDSFGRVLSDTNPGFQPFGFAGGLYDPQTGLVRFGARDYDPTLGRWTAKDRLLFGGELANLYRYTTDPINYLDLTGETYSWQRSLLLASSLSPRRPRN